MTPPSNKISYYADGVPFSTLPDDVKRVFDLSSDPDSEDSDGPRRISFAGFIHTSSGLLVFLPKTTDLDRPAQDLRRCSKILFRTLIRYSQNNIAGLVGEASDGLVGASQISLQIQLIRDWFSYGRYKHTETRSYFDATGRIEWKETLKLVNPLLNNDRPVYPYFVVTALHKHSQSLVAHIHAWAVAECDRQIGWLLTGDESDYAVPELANYATALPCSDEIAIKAIRKELETQYNARKIWLLKSLISIIERTRKTDTLDQMFGTLRFSRVWEVVCKSITDDSYELLQSTLPQPLYVGPENFRSSKARQIPDILLLRGVLVIVLDAKYYDVSVSLPGWRDIVKQFYYAKTLRHVNVARITDNYFLFPSPRPGQPKPSKVVLTVRENFSEELAKSLNEEFPPIKCLYVDVYGAMRSYLSGEKIEVTPTSVNPR